MSLIDDLGRPVTSEEFDQTSPPVVFEDLVIVGSRVPDRVQRRFDPPGTVQAYDARTGERRWVFFTIPQSNDDFGADTWEDESWRYTGHANVWGLMSLDAERGLLYVPTSTPSGDYWGGRRLGRTCSPSRWCAWTRGRASGSGTSRRCTTGCGTTISTRRRTGDDHGGRAEIDAVAEVSKQGFTYVFDRVTGEPVWADRGASGGHRDDVPGEVLYPTQPFPTKPPPFAQQGVFLEDANDLTRRSTPGGGGDAAVPAGPLFTPRACGAR